MPGRGSVPKGKNNNTVLSNYDLRGGPKGPGNQESEFETPINTHPALVGDDNLNPSRTPGEFDKEVEDFVNTNIGDETTRALKGLQLINRSPHSSQMGATALPVDHISRKEVTKIIEETMRHQTVILTEKFNAMMGNCIAEMRRATERQIPAEEVPPRPATARNVEFSETNDSYQNLFTRQSLGNPNVSHSSSMSNRMSSNFIKKEDLAEIKFDGKTTSVKQFLFKLRTLKEANDVSWDYITKNFFRCVTGSADTWYWSLVQKLDTAGLKLTWEILQGALENDFGGRQSDADISNMMWSRKQRYNESFEDFFDDIIKLNARLSVSKSDLEIINILKSNCSNRIVSGVYNYTTKNAQDFKRQCVKYENEVERRFKNSNSAYTKKISEMENPWNEPKASDKEVKINESECNIEALNMKKEKPKVKCGHCHQPVIFCYRCFTPDVTFPNCPNCHESENFKRSGSSPPPNSHSA